MSERLRSSQVDKLAVRDTDLRGRRVRNASDAVKAQDYVTLRQLEQYIAVAIKEIIFPSIDLQNFANLYHYTQATLPTTWGFAQENYLVWVTDYHHVLIWEGDGWNWGPGDSRNAGEIAFFDVTPGTGWKLINGNGDDGSAIGASHPIKILKSDGTTRDITTLDDLTGGGYLKGAAAFAGTLTAATVPTISGSTASGTAALGTPSGTAIVQSGTGITVASFIHTHTDSGHTHGVGTLVNSLPGDPIALMEALPYIRK